MDLPETNSLKRTFSRYFCSVHYLRKSYGSNLADLGTPVHTLKELMGHSNIQTTMAFYVKNNDENSIKTVNERATRDEDCAKSMEENLRIIYKVE